MEKIPTCSVLGELDFVASKVSLSFYRTIKIEFCRETTFYLEILQRDKVGLGYWRISQPPVMPQDHGLFFSAGDTRSRGGSLGWSEVPFLPDCGHLASPTSLLGGPGSDSERPPLRPESGLGRGSLRCVGLQAREKGRVIRASTPPVLRVRGDAQAQLAPWRTAGPQHRGLG